MKLTWRMPFETTYFSMSALVNAAAGLPMASTRGLQEYAGVFFCMGVSWTGARARMESEWREC